MRISRTAIAALLLSAAVVVPTQPSLAAPFRADVTRADLSDPALLAAISRAEHSTGDGSPRAERAPSTVPVEVLTDDVAAAVATIVSLGGTVTGSVDGHLVQADVPSTQVALLAATVDAEKVQYPRSANRLPRTEATPDVLVGSGVLGDEVTITNADEWQTAGHTGSGVKVGIVDYFDRTGWDIDEMGPLPTYADGNVFCRDSAPWDYPLCDGDDIDDSMGDLHGLAVAEIVHDMAPDAELYIATVNTTADLQAAIDWFYDNEVTIVTRSLGSPYDGPGDGTGPLAAVVDHAVALGMTWFNSAGNDGYDAYMHRSVPTTLAANGYVDFDSSAGVDTWLRLDSTDFLFDGIRWSNDWYLDASLRTDYSIEFWEPTVAPTGDHWNPTTGQVTPIDVGTGSNIVDANQRTGASPLEADNLWFDAANDYGGGTVEDPVSVVYMRIKRNAATPVGAVADTIEIALGYGFLESDYSNSDGSAAKAVVDSANPGLVAVGAVDPPSGTSVGYYSSRGPTTDGRIKPDLSAPSGFASVTYGGAFSGTSAAAPTAAGMATLLIGAGLATPGAALAALTKHFVTDIGSQVGPDNDSGTGKILLPTPPDTAAPATPAKYVALATPTRVLDTRAATHVGPASLVGPYARQSIIELDTLGIGGMPSIGVSAIVVNLTSVNSVSNGFVQAAPYLRSTIGGTSTLNISTVAAARPNFAIVPIGMGNRISIYLQAGGDVLVDLLGYYLDGQTTAAGGRFVPLASPERWTDSRGLNGTPLPIGVSSPRKVTAGSSIDVPVLAGTAVPSTAVPATSQVSALVVTVTATGAAGGGYLRVAPKGGGGTHSNVNFNASSSSANTAIVPIGTGGHISVFASQTVDVIVDVVGYITSSNAPITTQGLFVPITPGRAYDSRTPTSQPFTAGATRTKQMTGLSPSPLPDVPSSANGISANLTVAGPAANGYLAVYPYFAPSTSSLNFAAGRAVANGALLAVSTSGTVTALMSQAGHLIIDINGYFLPGDS